MQAAGHQRKRAALREMGWAIIIAGLAAYHNSFSGPFIFDDYHVIRDNPNVRHPWPMGWLLTGTHRPTVELSFAFNDALGGLNVWGYHVVNLVIHVLTALALFGLVRRTFLSERLRARYGHAAPWLALAVALLWVAHPLQTQSVTYLTQRAESLMGLFYLLTLYCVLRGSGATYRWGWYAAAVVSCALGMGSKPVMITAPLMVLLYDRCFLARSTMEALRHRGTLYLGLVVTCSLPPLLLRQIHPMANPSAGFGIPGLTPLSYAMTQPGILVHYVRLALWPHPLCFDYVWPAARSLREIALPASLVGSALLLTAWGWRRHRPLSFLGVWFFLILAPTSSVIPLADLICEYRMYLPLAAVLTGIVLGMYELSMRFLPRHPRRRHALSAALVVGSVAALGLATALRNADYHSNLSIWSDTVAKRPNNPRAHINLAKALARERRLDEAVAHLTYAIQLSPEAPEPYYNLAMVFGLQGNTQEAMRHYTETLRLQPDLANAHNNLGVLLAEQHRFVEAATQFSEAVRLKPDSAEARQNLERALEKAVVEVER